MTALSKREEIAIAILVACARNGFSHIRTEEAAVAAHASKDQTAQIVLQLTRAGLIETRRGRQGGIRLARRAEQITLGRVLDGIGAKRRLPVSVSARRNDPLDAIARAAAVRARETFESFTIADLAREQVADKLTCFDCSIRLGVVSRMHTGIEHPTRNDPQHAASASA